MSYIGFKRDRCYLAYYKSDFKHKFFPILINGNMFIINVDEKIIFCLEEEDKFSEKLCLALIKHRNNGKTIIVSGMLALLIFFLPVQKAIDIGTIPQASSEIIRNIPRTAQEELVLELRGGGNDISELIIKILLIWTMSRGYTTTSGLQPKPINRQFNRPGPNPRITPKLQENPVNRNNLGQRTCKSSQHPSMETTANSLSPKYSEFQNKYDLQSLPKRFDTNQCSAKKFKDLAKDSRSNIVKYDRVSIDEARAVIQAELQNVVIEPTRPSKLEARRVDLDYKVKGPGLLTHVDIKHPVGSDILIKQGQTISVEDMAYKMGQKIVQQKHRFVGLENGPVSPQNVGHIVDLCYVPNNEKTIVQQNILNGARYQGSDTGIIFVNDK
jgi:hypothetical protein